MSLSLTFSTSNINRRIYKTFSFSISLGTGTGPLDDMDIHAELARASGIFSLISLLSLPAGATNLMTHSKEGLISIPA